MQLAKATQKAEGSTKVRSLQARRNADIIEMLEAALEQARKGILQGAMLVGSKGSAGYYMEVSGDYARNPGLALQHNCRLTHRLNKLADSQQAPGFIDSVT